MKGLIEVYTGDGKGKTTAAMGLAIRAAGSGMKVLVTQFLKDGTSSEIKVLEKIDNITCISNKRSFGFIKFMSENQLKEAISSYNEYLNHIIIEASAYDVLVMDEFMAAYNMKIIDNSVALLFLKNKPEKLEVVLTGRDIPEEISDIADYITECKKIKHPYDKGIPARRGIEL